jgi:cytochrome c oxidase subunit II
MYMNLLLLLVILLTIFTCFRLMKVFDLAAKLRGREPYEITESENNINAVLVLFSLVGLSSMFFFLNNRYYAPATMLPNASKHGIEVDWLLHVNFVVISIAFLLCQVLLMWFAYKYRYNKRRRATHFAHSTKLELVWTILPAIVLVFLIGKGLIVWNLQMWPKDKPDLTIELYSRQFDWTARFAGEDKTLGDANFTMIDPETNILGIIIPETIKIQDSTCKADLVEIDSLLKYSFPDEEEYKDLKTARRRKNFQIQRVIEFKNKLKDKDYKAGYDDVVLQQEIHIPVNQNILLMLRSQDVIHAAYLPHFRVQMYTVPGVQTKFQFMPIFTTAEMRAKLENPKFDYILFCNNICGAAHFNMQMKIVVDTQEDWKKWMDAQTTFGTAYLPKADGAGGDTTKTAGTDSITKDTLPVVINNNGH